MLTINFTEAWQTLDWRLVLGIIAAYAVLDAIFAFYTLSVTQKSAIKAANYSSVYYFVMAAGVISYVHNFLYIIPAAIGSWIGTYLAIKRSDKS